MEEDFIFELDFIDNMEESGMSALSFVKDPATQINLEYFQQIQDSYNDYPVNASNNACRAIKYKQKNPNTDCGTQVGWTRANQLCFRRNITIETIARMASFKRHQQNKDVPYDKGCGGLMWDAWGGDEGIDWASRKLEMVARKMNQNNFSVVNEEKRLVQAPIMIPDTKIVRFSKTLGRYYVKFSKDVIERMMRKYFIDGKANRVNKDHDPNSFVDDVYMVESYITGERNKSELFSDVPDGTWIATYFVKDDELWDQIKSGEYRGFSLEGGFYQTLEQEQIEKIYSTIKDILERDLPDTEKEDLIKELLKIK